MSYPSVVREEIQSQPSLAGSCAKVSVPDDGGMKNLTVIENEAIKFHFHEAETLPF